MMQAYSKRGQGWARCSLERDDIEFNRHCERSEPKVTTHFKVLEISAISNSIAHCFALRARALAPSHRENGITQQPRLQKHSHQSGAQRHHLCSRR